MNADTRINWSIFWELARKWVEGALYLSLPLWINYADSFLNNKIIPFETLFSGFNVLLMGMALCWFVRGCTEDQNKGGQNGQIKLLKTCNLLLMFFGVAMAYGDHDKNISASFQLNITFVCSIAIVHLLIFVFLAKNPVHNSQYE